MTDRKTLTCVLCSRTGRSGFIDIDGKPFCASLAACERRQRGTGRRGVTASYLVRSGTA